MKIAIAGAGMSGSYLARRLIAEGIAKPKDITIYDPFYPRVTTCRIAPCAWGIHTKTIIEAAEKCNLEPEKYILRRYCEVKVGSICIKSDLCTFDKPKFICDCIDGIRVINDYLPRAEALENYDVIVDATAWRKVITNGEKSTEYIKLVTHQVRVHEERTRMSIYPLWFDALGYHWEFPLKDSTHIGFGYAESIYTKGSVTVIQTDSTQVKKFFDKYQNAICRCTGKIRASSPRTSLPLFVETKQKAVIIAVGESAGCISSASGGGNKEAIDGVEILLRNWEDRESYEKAMLKDFDWAYKEYAIVKKLCLGKRIGIRDLLTLKRNAKRYGFKGNFFKVWKLLKEVLRR